ncbi:MAG: EAL domain-containing protein [Pseudomonas sp.]
MLLELVENITLLVSLCWLHGMLMRYLEQRELLSQICSGLLFGLVCVLGMMIPIHLTAGVILDGRSVVLSMAAFFGGPLTGAIAGVVAAMARLGVGGAGMVPGLLNILMPVVAGLLFRHLSRSRKLPFNIATIAVLGLLVQALQSLILLVLLPAPDRVLFLEHALVPMVCVLVPGTLLLGLMLRDLQNQRRSRTALIESESYLRAVTDAVPDLTMVLDEDGRYLRIKTPNAHLLPMDPAEVLGKRLDEVFAPERADMFMHFIHRTLASDTPQSLEYTLNSLNGPQVFEARARSLDAPMDGKRAVVIMARNISERVALQRDQRIAAIAFETQQGMVIADAGTRIIRVNESFTKITGYSESEVVGQRTNMLSSGRQTQDFYRQMWQSLNRTGFWEGEIWNRRKDGDIFPEWLTISAVYDSRGEVTNYVASLTDISERKDAEERIQHLVFFDPLTGLANRRLLRDRLKQASSHCISNGQYAALAFLDLDNFKNINDLHGHEIGDELLCQVAERLKELQRPQDTVARLGGDEFVILLEGLDTDAGQAGIEAEQIYSAILTLLHEPFSLNGESLSISASIGVVLFNDDHHRVDELMQHADLSMYNAKAAGKNTLSFYDPGMQEAVSTRLKLEQEIRRGLTEGEFVLFLQPQTHADGTLAGAEALIRWQHPERGLLGPGTFIDIAERSDLIEQMDLVTLRQGCQLLARWAAQPVTAGLSLAVNISSRLLYKKDFIWLISQLLQTSGANPLRLKLEITESLLLTDKDKAIAHMQQLRDMGIRFSIDDFGTGYSSMAYLQQLPLDQIKIDQSFVRGLPADTSSLAIVRAIIAMAKSLGLEVIAEGVETTEHRDILLASGCEYFQGYYFGKPVSVSAFEATWLAGTVENG